MDTTVDRRLHAPQPAPHACTRCDVRRQSVCSVLQERELEAFASIVHNKRIAAGETIVAEGDEAGHFYNIVSGAARLVKLLPNGRRQIIGFLYPGDFLGLGTRDTYHYSAEALAETTLCQFDDKSFQSFLERCPDLRAELLERAGSELTVAQEQMLLLGRKTPTERLASFLLRLKPWDDDSLHLAMTRQDIADYLGLTIETVSRTFSRFKADGLIDLPSRAQVVIRDRDRLEEIAEEG